jgi:hypothetical protein
MKGVGVERAVTVGRVAEEVVDSEGEGEDLEEGVGGNITAFISVEAFRRRHRGILYYGPPPLVNNCIPSYLILTLFIRVPPAEFHTQKGLSSTRTPATSPVHSSQFQVHDAPSPV